MLLDETWRLFVWPVRVICGVVVVTMLIIIWATGGMGRLEWFVTEMGRTKSRHTAPTTAPAEDDFGNRGHSR